MKHNHLEQDNAYDADNDNKDNGNDSKDIMKEKDTNFHKRYDDFGHFSFHKCGQ